MGAPRTVPQNYTDTHTHTVAAVGPRNNQVSNPSPAQPSPGELSQSELQPPHPKVGGTRDWRLPSGPRGIPGQELQGEMWVCDPRGAGGAWGKRKKLGAPRAASGRVGGLSGKFGGAWGGRKN